MASLMLAKERKYFDSLRARLEKESMGRWVVIHETDLIGDFATFEAAAQEAVRKFGRGPYLIRQVGAPTSSIPASLAFAEF